MTDETPYHSFDRYEQGESWDYNTEFDKLDKRVELRGPLADRPSTAPGGSKFEVDDPGHDKHGAVYLFDDTTGEWTLSDRQLKSVNTGDILVNGSLSSDPDNPTVFFAAGENEFGYLHYANTALVSGDNVAAEIAVAGFDKIEGIFPTSTTHEIYIRGVDDETRAVSDIVTTVRNNFGELASQSTEGALNRSYSHESGASRLKIAIDHAGEDFQITVITRAGGDIQ